MPGVRRVLSRRWRVGLVRLRFMRWSIENWRRGYKFGPVQRFRCCDHTTPYHYANCEVGR